MTLPRIIDPGKNILGIVTVMQIADRKMLSVIPVPVTVERIIGLVGYNKDWLAYLLHRSRPGTGRETFRLRTGQVVMVHHDGRWTLNEIYRDRVYDVPGINLSKCRTVLDIGANVGVFALFAASIAPAAVIHCFEPDGVNFEMLRGNVEANPRAHIFAHQAAVGGKDGFAYLSGGATSVTHAIAEAGEQRVELLSLAHAVELCGGSVDFLKMDVEGAEREILSGCSDAVLQRIRAISMEWHYPMREAEVLAERLRALAFTVICIERDGGRFVKASRSA
jgi:FkbM family methyltransferase